jgi:hypothetical protein
LAKQFLEGLFEIKLYVKTEEDNINIGSFMIDLSKLLLPECKSQNIYSCSSNVYFCDLNSKGQESIKLSTHLSLFKSDLDCQEFFEVYRIVSNSLNNNVLSLRDRIDNDSKGLLRTLITPNFWEYIDMELLNLEADNGDLNINNIARLIEIFTDKKVFSEIYDYNDVINEIFKNKKFNLKKTNKLTIDKFSFTEDRLKEIFANIDGELFENLISIYRAHKPNVDLSVYHSDSNNIDLLDFILFLYSYKSELIIVPKEEEDVKEKVVEVPSHIALTIYSAMNIGVSNISRKPNCYFILSWGEDYFISETIIKTSHPAWNKKIDIKFNPELILAKINNDIAIQFYSKDDNLFNQNLLQDIGSDAIESKRNYDEYIGEIRIQLLDILNLLNENNEYVGFFHIKDKFEHVKGQAEIKIYFDDSVLNTLATNNFKASLSRNEILLNSYALSNKNPLDSMIILNHDSPKFKTHGMPSLPTKKYEFEDQYKDLDYNGLWEQLNQNTVIIFINLASNRKTDQRNRP